MESAASACEKITSFTECSASALPIPTLDRNVCALNAVALFFPSASIFSINSFPSGLGQQNSICLEYPAGDGIGVQRGSYLLEQVRGSKRLRHTPIAPIGSMGTGHEDNRQRPLEFQNTVRQLLAIHSRHHYIR